MRCTLCKLRFTKQQSRKAVTLYDAAGRLSGMAHYKCVYIAKKHKWVSEDGSGRYFTTSPTSWDKIRRTVEDMTPEEQDRRDSAEAALAALQNRLKVIELQAALEERPSQWSDWRDPQTLDLDELLAVTEKAKEAALGP